MHTYGVLNMSCLVTIYVRLNAKNEKKIHPEPTSSKLYRSAVANQQWSTRKFRWSAEHVYLKVYIFLLPTGARCIIIMYQSKMRRMFT